jgi:hypothetical protein
VIFGAKTDGVNYFASNREVGILRLHGFQRRREHPGTDAQVRALLDHLI